MEESEKIHLRAEISAGIPMLCSNVILQFAFVLVILIGVQMLHTGEINILYFLGYVLASIKVRESVEAVSMNVAELYYLDSHGDCLSRGIRLWKNQYLASDVKTL